MSNNHLCRQMAVGALAGVAGTMVLQTIRKMSQKYAAGSEPPIREHPGVFMVHQAEKVLPEKTRERVSEETKAKLGDYLGLCYGATFGALYGALRPRGGPHLLDGAWFGLLTWAAGYIGWLPATGLMPPVWKHQPGQVAKPVAEHAVYGLATVAAYDWITDQIRSRTETLPRLSKSARKLASALT